jgi:Xaa-Pro dipeptidase
MSMATAEVTAVTPTQIMFTMRRLDIDAKQQAIAKLLNDSGSEGVLVLHPANFRWLTSGATPVGLYGRDELPGLYLNQNQRWLLGSSVDTQRFFDDELDALGFQQKEWHWSSGREHFLQELTFGRKLLCDQPYRDCQNAGTFFASERRKLSAFESERMHDLGKAVAHAVEATARNFVAGDSEEEIAGHLAHRLMKHGIEPIATQINADGNVRVYRRRGFGSTRVKKWCYLQATGRKYGLHATVGRTVWFGKPDDQFRVEFDCAAKLNATHLLSARINDRTTNALEAGKALLKTTPFEHEWRASPPVCLTGREPSEGLFLSSAKDIWIIGWAAVWQDRIGASAICDTYILNDSGWDCVTPFSDWPLRRVLARGEPFNRADYLVRE